MLNQSVNSASARCRLFLVVWAVTSIVMASPVIGAETVKNIRSMVDRPVLVRGGTIMLPLAAERPGVEWPESLEIKYGKTGSITGTIAWLEPAVPSIERHWTDDPRLIRVRAVLPTDDSSVVPPSSGFGPFLVADAPKNAEGELRLGKQKLKPVWMDAPLVRAVDPHEPPMVRERSPDRPDPDSPFEYWRWVLLAQREGRLPPEPLGDAVQQQVARSIAALWQAGLARLERADAAVARAVTDQLIQTATDRGQRFAVWVTDPQRLATLLDSLLNTDRRDRDVVAEAENWVQQADRLILWPQTEYGPQVRVTMCSLAGDPVPATLRWRDDQSPPTRLTLPPRVLTTVTMQRVPLPAPVAIGFPAPPEPTLQTLIIDCGGREVEMNFGVRQVAAKPPGVFFRPLAAPLTLADAWARQSRSASSSHATLAQVRRLGGRWEVFFDCRRPESTEVNRETPRVAGQVRDFDDLRGMEAVTLLLGEDRDAEPLIWLTIPEDGYPLAIRGQHDGTLQIHKKSHGDRWYCRVVLPDAWFSAAETSPAFIGFVRSHGDSEQLESGPNACVPWRATPSRAAINLDHWDDLPREQ